MPVYQRFLALHQQAYPFILANAWDVASAHVFAEAGFPAIGTSSAAIASARGYADGQNLPFPELLQLARRLVAAVRVPVSVDLEGGYSPTVAGICQHLSQLADAGVVGVNLEDSRVAAATRTLLPLADFAAVVETVKSYVVRQGLPLFLNIRTDACLLRHPDPVIETSRRARAYEAAGADGVFVPGLVALPDVEVVTAATRLPLNLMAWPGLPSEEELKGSKVRRLSMGDFAHQALLRYLAGLSEQMQVSGTFSPLF